MATFRQPIDYGSGKPSDRFARPIGDGPLDQPAKKAKAPAVAAPPPPAAPAPREPRRRSTAAEKQLVEDRVLACLREAAAAGRRCPTAAEISIWMDDRGYGWHGAGNPASVTKLLALHGRIRVNIFGKNFRQVEILEPPTMETASKRGAGAPWMVIDRRGVTRQ